MAPQILLFWFLSAGGAHTPQGRMAGEKSVSSLLALLHRDITFVPVQRSLGGLNVSLASPEILAWWSSAG